MASRNERQFSTKQGSGDNDTKGWYDPHSSREREVNYHGFRIQSNRGDGLVEIIEIGLVGRVRGLGWRLGIRRAFLCIWKAAYLAGVAMAASDVSTFA